MEQIKVVNVKCGGCAATIREKLSAVPGVTEVAVDVPAGMVSVDGHGVSRAAVERILRDIGYPPKEH